MLEGVLEAGGTASAVQVPGYVLAGKTGTAQKVVDGTYSDTEYVGSFIGFAPAEDPRLLVSVVVDSPPYGAHYGGTVAAPAFGEIAKFALPHLGVAPDGGTAEPGRALSRHRRSLPGRGLESPRWSSVRCCRALTPRSRATRTSRSAGSPTTTAWRGRGSSSSACPAPASTATSSPQAPSTPARPALVVERRLGLAASEALVADARAAMAPAAATFCGDPTAELAVAGVTGTNGKTTTAFLIRHLLESGGVRTGLLGTVKACRRRHRGRGRANDAGGDRPAGDVPGDARRRAIAPVRWRSPRTPCACGAPTTSGSRRRSSRT